MVNDPQIPDFLRDLEEANQRTNRSFSNESELVQVNMKNGANWGKVIIIPVSGENSEDGAIKQLNRVARIGEKVSGTKKDGTPYEFWRPRYVFLDPKYYGDLTDDQLKQLDRIKSKFNTAKEMGRDNISQHQLTIIQGLCVKHTDRSNPVKTLRENTPVILIFESKNFEKTFRNKINSVSDTLGSYAWINEMTGRDLVRKRFFTIDFYLNKEEGAGFQVSVDANKFDEDTVKMTGGKLGFHLEDVDPNLLDKFKNPIKAWMRLPQDGGIWNQNYIDETEAILNGIIKGDDQQSSQEKPTTEPTTIDSNSGFVAQAEVPEIPTGINVEVQGATTSENDEDDDLPF